MTLLCCGKEVKQCSSVSCHPILLDSLDTQSNMTIPAPYADLKAIYSKASTLKWPPHHPWECSIKLLAGMTPPTGHVYPLSFTETKAMEEYISEALMQGYICPSISLAASSLFF